MTIVESFQAPKVIAEIGCNHKGEMAAAKELISIAAMFCKADVAKFQKRNPRELLSTEQYNAPHPNAMHSYGNTYGEHREFLEFTVEEHKQLSNWCREFGVAYSSSVWDMASARDIVSITPALIKIGSASNSHHDMLRYLCDNFGGEIHVSLGMTTHEEEHEIVGLFDKKGRAKDVVLYSCTSGLCRSAEVTRRCSAKLTHYLEGINSFLVPSSIFKLAITAALRRRGRAVRLGKRSAMEGLAQPQPPFFVIPQKNLALLLDAVASMK